MSWIVLLFQNIVRSALVLNNSAERKNLLIYSFSFRLSDRKGIDVVRAESSRSDRIPSRPASTEDIPLLNDPDIVQKLHSAYEEIAVLYDIR